MGGRVDVRVYMYIKCTRNRRIIITGGLMVMVAAAKMNKEKKNWLFFPPVAVVSSTTHLSNNKRVVSSWPFHTYARAPSRVFILYTYICTYAYSHTCTYMEGERGTMNCRLNLKMIRVSGFILYYTHTHRPTRPGLYTVYPTRRQLIRE